MLDLEGCDESSSEKQPQPIFNNNHSITEDKEESNKIDRGTLQSVAILAYYTIRGCCNMYGCVFAGGSRMFFLRYGRFSLEFFIQNVEIFAKKAQRV